AQELMNDGFGDDQLVDLAFGQAPSLLPANGPYVPFEIAHPSLAGVVTDEVAHGLAWKLDLLGRDAVLIDLPRYQVLKRDVDFFLLGIALQFDDLHAISQWLSDWVQHVGGGNEEHFG